MRKSKKLNEIIVHVKTETVADFFARGKSIAKQLDKGEKPAFQRIVSHGRCRVIKTADSNPIKLCVETII